MKKILFLFMLVFAITAVSCGDKAEKMKKQYIEACADNDFEKAHSIVSKLEAIKSSEAMQGLRYVNDKEIYYLLAKPSRDNDQRILFLYNTYNSYELPNMNDVIDVAISMGNENLPEKLIKAGVKPTEENLKSAVSADLPQIVELIVSKQPKFFLLPDVNKFYKTEIGEAKFKKELVDIYNNSDDDIREKILLLATNENLPEASILIKSHLEEKLKIILSTSIPPRPALGMVKSTWNSELPEKHKEYQKAVSEHNNKIREFIAEAISHGHLDLANKALSDMKPTLQSRSLGDWAHVVEHEYDHHSAYDALQVSENHNDINEARKLIMNAQ